MKQMMIGNAHIDPVWFWRWQEGYHEIKATFLSALDRLEETPGFVFTCACADYYRWVEENDPAMFERIRARVQEGRWVVVGGMWIQPDMNVPGGESIARQLLLSQRYFREHLGVTVTEGYNVDTFGHNAMLPQLLRRADISRYVWMRPQLHENAEIPQGTFLWESPDGSRVTAHRIHNEYTSRGSVAEKIDLLFALSEELGQPMMCFYGVGNHGGGPTIEHLREIDDYKAAAPRGADVDYASPRDFFDHIESSGIALPVWRSELQHHASGCYSTHSASKMKHRTAENALLRMEKLGCLARMTCGHEPRKAFVRQAWQNLLFNEFHDAMGGCSAPDVMEDVVVQFDESLSIAAREENAALQRISWQIDTIKGHPGRIRSKIDGALWHAPGQGTPVVVFNPHAFEAEGTVQIRRPIRFVRDDQGNPVPVQLVRAARTNHHNDIWDGAFRASVPALGWRLYWVYLEEGESCENRLSAAVTHLENEHIRAEFDPAACRLKGLYRKGDSRNILAAPPAVRLMDITHVDTWAHNVFTFDQPGGEFIPDRMELIETGPVRAAIRIHSRCGASELTQTYTLYAGADTLEVSTAMHLNEKHRMVKWCIPTVYADGKDISEIPYGAIERTACGQEEPCQRWIAMHGQDGGLALMNDGKYSYSAQNGEIRMTLANTSVFADHYGQDLRDDSCRYMDQGEQRFTCLLKPYQGAWQAAQLDRSAELLNQPMPFVVETYHEGPLSGEGSALSIDNPAVALGALKRAEDDCGWILRLAEQTGTQQTATVTLPLIGRTLTVSPGPWEIITQYIPDDPDQPVRPVLLTEYDL